MSDLTPKTSSKGEASRQQEARIPAPATGNIDTNHDVDAKKLAHAPPENLECDQETLRRLGNPGNEDVHLMNSEEMADAKKLAHAPPESLECDQETLRRLGNPGNEDIRHNMNSGEDGHVQNMFHVPPEPRESDRANPGAFRIGGQDNDDENTVSYGEEVRSHGTTTDVFQVPEAHLVEEDPVVEEDPEVNIGVAVVAKDEGGSRKRLVYILIGISVILAIAFGVTLTTRSSQSGTTPAPTPAPTPSPTLAPTRAPGPLERESMIALIQSRSAATTFSNSVSPQNQALDWILSDTYFSGGLSDDRLVQRFALATLHYSMDGGNWSNGGGWLNSINECDWNSEDFNLCSQESMVQRLFLSQDNLSGSIPSEFGLLTQLTELSLFGNQLTGSIPSELALLTQLNNLYLIGNELTGSIPSSLCSAGVPIIIDCGKIACTCCISYTGTSCPSG